MQLLEEYAQGRSEEAFTALVSRNINLVYSAAMRSVNNPHQAEEITQAVFVLLALKSGSLPRGTVLSGWLYQTARLTACNYIRSETRRQEREQQFQSAMNETDQPEAWTLVGPLLEEAMAQLNERDRDAIVLRFFEGKALKDVGGAFGNSEEAAKKRVSRALDKLRDFFHRRGITMPSAALAAAIAENSIQAAPAGLAASVVSAAAGAVQGTALTASTLGLVKGAIHIMTTAKIGVAIGACAAATIIALQWHRVSTQKQAVTQLEAQVAQVTQTSHTQQAEIAKLQERNASYAKTMETMSHDVAKARARAAAAFAAKPTEAAAAGTRESSFAESSKDSAMLHAWRDRLAMNLKEQFAPLFKRLNLSTEEEDKFCAIIADKGLNDMEAAQSGKPSPSDEKAMQADLHSLLGDAGFAQFEDYNKNDAVDMGMIISMKRNFVDNPFSDTQQQQLLQAMRTARKSVEANNPLTKASDQTAVMDQYLQQQQQIHQIVGNEAASFLSPDQLQILTNMLLSQFVTFKPWTPTMQYMFTNAPGGP